ncbi:hypothetical protein FGO68_gene12650 [Halteria grandinella]|uniref:J domain-containing protein n=1 Tax=Halteria grandinella TaxID=5974 RepID=A0A8J8SYP4_HALGN|nr:hypothetical protein FGO68_gene12650 [Halteria grandinella]
MVRTTHFLITNPFHSHKASRSPVFLQAEGFIYIGASLLAVSFAGKQGLHFYRSVMNKTAFNSGPMIVGRFYKGCFESPMTRKEASLILGVREMAEEPKVMEAYKKIMFMNHPDNGGSTFLATKINEAKELLLSGADKK